jgi:hypothetical protein
MPTYFLDEMIIDEMILFRDLRLPPPIDGEYHPQYGTIVKFSSLTRARAARLKGENAAGPFGIEEY